MQAIENAAFISIGRACGFAGLAIFCLMFGLSFEVALAARAGGILCAILTVTLTLYGNYAHKRPYKRTELWLILKKDDRPPAGIAQRVIGQRLRETYFSFAKKTATISIVLLGFALAFQILVE